MQIAESNDRKRRTKLLSASRASDASAPPPPINIFDEAAACKELAFLPDTYLLRRFVSEFLKARNKQEFARDY